MLPIKLTLQAFGAYPNKIEIPFYKLGKSNVYLITGVTGSGKTTLFDAICFALFNSSSTSLRGNATLRSHYAKLETPSYVELEFLFNGEKYKVSRTPSYYRNKARGEGQILENSKAQIVLPDSKVITTPKEVDKFIQDLLGLDIHQFSQIALLAQGEFLKLLNADTKTRAEIFRNIFKTHNFLSFQEKLKENTLKYKQEFELSKNAILQYISMLEYDEEKINSTKNYYLENSVLVNFDEFIFDVINQNKLEFDEINKFETNLNELNSTLLDKQKELLIIKNKADLILQKDNVEKELSTLDETYKKAQVDYLSIPKLQLELDNLNLEFRKLEDNFNKASEVQKLQDNLENNKKLFDELIKKENEIKEEILAQKKNHLIFEYSNYLLINEEYEEKSAEFSSFQNEIKKLSIEFDEAYHLYLSNIAGTLAQSLLENEPCPVCGSLEHPNKAKLENKEITKEFVENLKENLEKNKELLNSKAENCSVLNEKIKSKLEAFDKLKDYYKINLSENELNLPSKKENYEEKIKLLEENLQINNDKIQEYKALNITLESKIETIKKDLKNLDLEEITLFYNKTSSDIKEIKTKIENYRSNYEKEQAKLVSLKSQYELLDKQIEALNKVDENKLNDIEIQIKEIELNKNNLEITYKNLNSKFDSNNKLINQIKEKYSSYQTLEKNYLNYKTLSDCANGTLKGKSRLAFEQYIQGYYLDMVLYYANITLKSMTKNQFQLLRKKDASLQGKTGLDLEVMDFHTFKTRDTKTLSGGESFKAALALALGLSRCISEMSGVINIDAMFIDEGFGSLDSESLELAMDVIADLSDKGSLVGVISHVEELKSKIQNQIISIKTQTGSTVELTF